MEHKIINAACGNVEIELDRLYLALGEADRMYRDALATIGQGCDFRRIGNHTQTYNCDETVDASGRTYAPSDSAACAPCAWRMRNKGRYMNILREIQLRKRNSDKTAGKEYP